jgi:hypothetical protein
MTTPLLLRLSTAAAVPPACNYTIDATENKMGMVRGGNYFAASMDSANTKNAAACALLCCATDACQTFSLNDPWDEGPWYGCVHGKPCCSLATGRGPFKQYSGAMNITTGLVQDVAPSTGKPPGVSRSFDCAMRKLAFEYAQAVHPGRGSLPSVFDGLQLSRCGVTPAAAVAPNPVAAAAAAAAAATAATNQRPEPEIFVSVNGSDGSGSGTLAAPYATPHRGVAACRRAATAVGSSACTLTLRAGTYFLADSPLQLSAMDSGLTIRSYPGEQAELSGGEPLSGLTWSLANLTAAAAANLSRTVAWKAPFRAAGGELPALRLRDTGRRVVRARHPNVDPELMGARRSGNEYEGWLAANTANWYPATPGPTPGQDFVSGASDWGAEVDWSDHMQMGGGLFTIGHGGGRCDDLLSGVAYWCGQHIPRGDNYLHNGPGGLRHTTPGVLPPIEDPKGLVVHMWADSPANEIGPWFTLQWQVAGVGVNGTLEFAPGGGTQGSEGWLHPDGVAGAWAVENALELLDAPNEFFYDAEAEMLYYAPNTTSAAAAATATTTAAGDGGAVAAVPPADDELIGVRGKVLVSVTGSQEQPARNISLVNLTLRDTAPTYLDRHDIPSQGDWALVHTAAVVAAGTVGFTMQGCLVTRVDGQGLLLEGYHRGTTIRENEFEWIGSHAMVAWGKTSPCLNSNCSRKVPNGGDGPDGRNGEQPVGVLVQGNLVREVGIWERQGTMWNQALTAQTSLRDNIFFNCDRAALNINDGL